MKHLPALAAALCLSLGAAAAHADCYTVLNAKGKIISQSPNPPVDMSKPLHETVPAKFGAGATMVFGIADGNCGKELENTWGSAARDAAFLLRLWPILLLAFLAVVPLIALGAGTAVIGVGAPVLVLGLSVSSHFAQIGRRAVADVRGVVGPSIRTLVRGLPSTSVLQRHDRRSGTRKKLREPDAFEMYRLAAGLIETLTRPGKGRIP